MVLRLTNNATSTLASSISSTSTSIAINAADAAQFPVLSTPGDWFPITVIDSASNTEIMKVTARADAVLTVTRAQEGTSAKAFPAGSRVDLRLTAGAVAGITVSSLTDAPVTAAIGDDAYFWQSGVDGTGLFKRTWANLKALLRHTTLAGYGITDAYTKTETDNAIEEVSTTLTEELAKKLDTSASTSFLRKDGSVVADKLTINSFISGGANGLQLQNASDSVNMYMAGSTGWGYFLHVGGNDFYILADRNRSKTWDTGNYPLRLVGSTSAGYIFGQQIFTYAGGTLSGKLVTAPFNANSTSDGNSNFEVRNVGGAGDGGLAAISFHCQGGYGIKLHLRSDGYFGIGGWSSTAWRWYSVSNGDMIAAGNIGAYSDPRLKEEVERIDHALDVVEKLDGVRFRWNHKTTLIGKPGERDIGVLADQVEAVLPEIVSRSIEDEANGGERWRIVAYDKLTPVLIEAVKALRQENRDLAARIAALEGRP
jgi:hypothetical protein